MNFRISIIVCVLSFVGVYSAAQNLVPNHSFENISSCPTSNSQHYLASPWQVPTSSITTPDLFNTCFSGGSTCTVVGVPGNFAGNTTPRTGNSYAGIVTKYTAADFREYLVVQLNNPLVADVDYSVGVYIKLADWSRYATSHFGLHLSSNILSQTEGCCNNSNINLDPSIENNSVISDRTSWTLVGGTYTASGGEQYLTIGCFNPDDQNSIIDYGPQGGSCPLVTDGAYYYIDDAFVQVATPLDVEGLNFVASSFGEQQAMLSWTLSDASLFESLTLERSSDGQYFEPLVEGLPAQSGTFLDDSPITPDSWYRMQTTDKNGLVQNSEVRRLSFETTTDFKVRAWPNPFRDQLAVEIYSEIEGQNFVLELVDYLGRSTRTISVQASQGTSQVFLSDLVQLSAGVYILKISDGVHREVIRLIHP